jgi:hypothetical protein
VSLVVVSSISVESLDPPWLLLSQRRPLSSYLISTTRPDVVVSLGGVLSFVSLELLDPTRPWPSASLDPTWLGRSVVYYLSFHWSPLTRHACGICVIPLKISLDGVLVVQQSLPKRSPQCFSNFATTSVGHRRRPSVTAATAFYVAADLFQHRYRDNPLPACSQVSAPDERCLATIQATPGLSCTARHAALVPYLYCWSQPAMAPRSKTHGYHLYLSEFAPPDSACTHSCVKLDHKCTDAVVPLLRINDSSDQCDSTGQDVLSSVEQTARVQEDAMEALLLATVASRPPKRKRDDDSASELRPKPTGTSAAA